MSSGIRTIVLTVSISLVAALLFAGVAYWGTRLPRQKVIHACVDGPVSLELIASRYDILKVDGKELTLRVR